MYVFSIYSEEKLSQLDKLGRKIVEKRISDILSEIEMSADMSAGGELNRQQQNPYSGFNSIPQQGQQGSCNIQGQSTWIYLTNDFLYFMQYLYMVWEPFQIKPFEIKTYYCLLTIFPLPFYCSVI